MKTIFAILFLLSFLLQTTVFSQEIKKEKIPVLPVDTLPFHSPKKAAIMSAVLPGLGQVYNKKYWKVPIVYAGIGTSLYFAISNNKSYNETKTAYINRIDGDPNTIEDEKYANISDESLLSTIDANKRNRDLSFIIASLFYVFNIVDASVDAHLFTFPKNDKLSFNLQPTLQYTQNNTLTKGLTLVIKL